jgi:hypothetical protein
LHVLVKHCLAILLFLHGYLNLYPRRWLLINTILSFSNQVLPPLLLAITPHPISKETVHVIDITDQLYTLLLWCLVSAFWTFLCVTCWMNSIYTCIYIYIHVYIYIHTHVCVYVCVCNIYPYFYPCVVQRVANFYWYIISIYNNLQWV